VVIADDNFTGNKKEIKNNLLPAMKAWMQKHKYPFIFSMESSIDLADDDNLMVDPITFSIYGYHYRKVFGLSG